MNQNEKLYYVYVLKQESDDSIVEVGETTDSEKRFYQHTKVRPNSNHGHGHFYGRTDLRIEIVGTFFSRHYALAMERMVKIEHKLPLTEYMRDSKGGKASGPKNMPKVNRAKVICPDGKITTVPHATKYCNRRGLDPKEITKLVQLIMLVVVILIKIT